eukprot:1619993-Prymnesium_polylepis.1
MRRFGSVRRDTRQRHPTRWPGRGCGMRQSTPACASRVDCVSSEVTGDTPARVRRFPRGGSPRVPNLDRIWIELGRGRSLGGQGRSKEIE